MDSGQRVENCGGFLPLPRLFGFIGLSVRLLALNEIFEVSEDDVHEQILLGLHKIRRPFLLRFTSSLCHVSNFLVGVKAGLGGSRSFPARPSGSRGAPRHGPRDLPQKQRCHMPLSLKLRLVTPRLLDGGKCVVNRARELTSR